MSVPAQVLAAVRSIPHPRQEPDMAAPAPSPAEQEVIDRFGIFEPEEDVERLAERLHVVGTRPGFAEKPAWERWTELAAAALAEMRPYANRRAAEELEAAARGVMAGATEVAGLPVAVRQALTIAATTLSARAAALASPARAPQAGER